MGGQFKIHPLQSLQNDESDAFDHAILQYLTGNFEKNMGLEYS